MTLPRVCGGTRLRNLIVVVVRFLFAEVAAHHVVEQTAELIEESHEVGICVRFRNKKLRRSR